MKVNKHDLTIGRGIPFTAILEYKEDGKNVFTDFYGYQFKAQFRTAKSQSSVLLATTSPIPVGLGQIKLQLTDIQTPTLTGSTVYYDVLGQEPGGMPELVFQGQATMNDVVTQWAAVPPITTVSPVAGIFNSHVSVSFSVNVANSITYYTTDGSVPTTGSLQATGSIVIDASKTVKFFSVDPSGNTELPKSVEYIIDTIPPVTSCTVISGQNISTIDAIQFMSDKPGVVVYFTTNGIFPSVNSPIFVTPFTLPVGTFTIKFFAVDLAGNVEAVQTISNVTVSAI